MFIILSHFSLYLIMCIWHSIQDFAMQFEDRARCIQIRLQALRLSSGCSVRLGLLIQLICNMCSVHPLPSTCDATPPHPVPTTPSASFSTRRNKTALYNSPPFVIIIMKCHRFSSIRAPELSASIRVVQILKQ